MRKLTMLVVAAMINYAVFGYLETDLEELTEFVIASNATVEIESEGIESGVSGGNGVTAVANKVSTVTGAESPLPERLIEDISQSGVISEDDSIYHVSFPTGAVACMDPGNLSGKGQIFSDEYEIENYGNTNVAIKINKIDITYGYSETMYEISELQVMDHCSEIKKINVDMVWKDAEGNVKKILHVMEGMPEEFVLYLEASEYGSGGQFVSLREGSRGSFSFTGTLNANPNIVWEDGEIMAHFDYEIVSVQGENSSRGKSVVSEKIPGVLGEKLGEEGDERKFNTVSSGDAAGSSFAVSGNDPLT